MRTHTHSHTKTYRRGREAKQSFGVNSWDYWDGCGRFYAEKAKISENWMEPWSGGLCSGCFEELCFTLGFRGPAVLIKTRTCEKTGLQDLLRPHPGQRSLFDSEADMKQLLLWVALRTRCYQWAVLYVTPANFDSALSKQHSLCIYPQWESVLHKSTEMLNSTWGLICRLVEESK